jgi:predicted methyltransferase
MNRSTLLVTAFVLALVWPVPQAWAEAIATETPPPHESIATAIADPGRPATDREQDATRRPEEILAFLGVAPGMRVLDAFSAGGYYTELLARIVGSEGEVIAYNNPPYAKFARKGIAARYVDDRLPNVQQVTSTLEQLELAPVSLDAAIFVMSYHDLYWRPADGSWPPTDPSLLLGKLHAALKPGGVILVQDHVAAPGGEISEVVDKLHRIDPAIRGKTDQFVFRFRKPLK